MPFNLTDAHDSITQLLILEYVNIDGHKSKVCIGIPNGAGNFDLSDFPQHNGSHKKNMTEILGSLKEKGRFKNTLITRDGISPIVNIVWYQYFGNGSENKKANMERGCYPANKCIFSYPDILRTKPRPTYDVNLPRHVSLIKLENQPIGNFHPICHMMQFLLFHHHLHNFLCSW